ncbi:hypothetical protein [Hartmannibacter diazotrophicus]|uniref:hypothetical protein n=1 Tax=Hartmannibacter diazotrophicus TaxID=1482074 RepID=UPI0012FDB1CE|nr:hypothetical protein [Hartmannibacter diazotrophicus]
MEGVAPCHRYPDNFPTIAEIKEREGENTRRVEATRRRVAEDSFKRKAEKVNAIEGLQKIRDNRELSNFERDALLTAIRLLGESGT